MKAFILSLILMISFTLDIYAQGEGKDQVYLKNGQILSGTLVEINHGQYVRLMVDDRYLEPFLYEHIEKVVQNQMFDKPDDVILLKSGELIGGIILKIVPNTKVDFTSEILSDTLEIKNEDIHSIEHAKRKLPHKVKMAYKGDHNYLGSADFLSY